MGVRDFSQTAGSNGSVSSQNWAEGQAPSSVNDSARQLLADLAAWWELQSGKLTAGGTANALTLTPTTALSAYTDGDVIRFRVASTNTGSATLAVSGLSAATIYYDTGGGRPLIGGELLGATMAQVTYVSAISGFVLNQRALPPVSASVNLNGSNQIGVAASTWTKVTFGTELYDYGSKWDASTNYRWTPGRVGRCLITARVGWAGIDAGAMIGVRIRRNGGTGAANIFVNQHAAPGGAQFNGVEVSAIVETDADDYFEIEAYHESTSAKDIEGDVTQTWAQFTWLPNS